MDLKKEIKRQLKSMVSDYLKQAVFSYVPDIVNINLKPMKNFMVDQGAKPKVNDMVKVTGGVYTRKQVLEFKDQRYNYPQY